MGSILIFLIALTFIFALISLITQSICEMVISWIGMRANFLKGVITETLGDVALNKNYAELLYDHPQIDLTKKDYKSVPSYISSANFSETLIDVFCREYENAHIVFSKDEQGNTTVIDNTQIKDAFGQFKSGVDEMNYSDLKILLTGFIKRSSDLASLQKNIQEWYDELMNRATGWFKSKLQAILFTVSLVFVVSINANLFTIVDSLNANPALAEKISVTAETYVASHPNAGKTTDTTLAHILKDVDNLKATNVPLGWDEFQRPPLEVPEPFTWKDFKQSWMGVLTGWLLMAILASLGAPFWFQLLSKFIDLRKTGVKPEEDPKPSK
jgi:hypothetical protein